MEREKELSKLTNVLRRTARSAMQAEWTGGDEGAARHCLEQYNRILARLMEMEPSLTLLFEPLPSTASLATTAVASRQLAAYFEDETGESHSGWMGAAAAFDPESFKEFWRQSAVDVEDLGEHIRETVQTWARGRRKRWQEQGGSGEEASDPRPE